jgi:hypothetical protein
MKGLKAEENIQWEIACYKAKENLEKSVAEDLRKSYSAKHWEVIQELFQILGFTGIDDKRTLSSDTASESFMQSCEKFIEIRNQSLLLFGFKSRAKETPDLHSAIKTINAIAGNWCGYTVESDKKRIGSKGQQVRQYSYRINRQPYNGIGFGDKGAPELPPYRSKTDNDIQEFFDSIGQAGKTNNTSAQIIIQLSLDHIRFYFSFFIFAPSTVINSTMCATDSSIGIGSHLTDRAYCSRKGIKMSGTS